MKFFPFELAKAMMDMPVALIAHFTNMGKKLDPTNDGCTGAPDIDENVLKCCKVHDFWWRNPHLGINKFKADWLFFKCIKKHKGIRLACLYYGIVSTFGVLFYVKEEWVNYKYDDGNDFFM